MKKIIQSLVFVLLMLFWVRANAQRNIRIDYIEGPAYISGPTEGYTDQSYTYYLVGQSASSWNCTNCNMISSDQYSATIEWYGEGGLTANYSTGNSVLYVNVECRDYTINFPRISSSSGCNGTVYNYSVSEAASLEREYGTKYIYYWQLSQVGRIRRLSNSTNSFVSIGNKVHLKAYNLETGCWASNYVDGNFVENTVQYPEITKNYSCEQITLEIDARNSSSQWNFYWQNLESGESKMHDASQPFVVTELGIYYLKAFKKPLSNPYDNSTCWASNMVTFTDFEEDFGSPIPAPLQPSIVKNDICSEGINLNLHNLSNEEYTYFWQISALGEDISNSQQVLTVTQAGDYFVRARKSEGCWGKASVPFHVSEQMLTGAPLVANLPNSESSTETTTGTLNRPVDATMTNVGNYVRSYTLLEEGTSTVDFTVLNAMTNREVVVATGYFDGLGRPSQTVQKGASPLGKDVVGFHKYDDFGRETKQYLPYVANSTNGEFKNSAPLDQYNFYKNASNVAHTDWAFAETDFESSPLNRILASASPGESWVGNGNKVHSEQLINSETDGIRIFRTVHSASAESDPISALESAGIYADGQLMIQKLTDENGNETFGYTNKLGQTILKRSALGNGTFVQTYYVYDDLGRQRFILQPNAVELLAQNGFSLDFTNSEKQEAFEAQVFWYRYDYRNRPIAKKIPSQDGEVRMVYDQLDRLVLSQDAKQHLSGEWNYTQYDVLSRPVATGVCHFGGKTHSQLLADLKNQVSNINSTLVESGSTKDYDFASSFPHGNFGASQIELLSVTYYDGYEAVDAKYDFRAVTEFENIPKTDFSNQTNRVRGMLTATRVKVLNTDNWLWTVSHYDKKGRPIQIVADNHLGGVDVASTLHHDFNSQVLKSKMEISVNGVATNILTWKTYDHAGRVLTSHYKLNEQDEELLATYQYNELGELISKILGKDEGLQQVDFTYNIRGWLTKINDLEAESDKLWAMELSYDKGFEKVQLNGNIAGAKWKSKRNDDTHAYGYQYDKLNRLTQADYRYSNEESDGFINTKQDFTVFGIDYDLNGNILKLNRQGAIGKNTDGDWLFGAMDRLNYSYSGNQLLAVDDRAGTDASAGDFMDIDQLYCSTGTIEYSYDANGSLEEDKNKGLSGMTYNRMNLPESVTTEEGEVRYGYDAAGIKLWKEVFENGALKKRTDYLGGLIITDSQIEFIPHEEGRFLPKADGTYKTEFHYKDHLGNLRLAFREEIAEHSVTMETENATEEEGKFDNVAETRITSLDGSLSNTDNSASLLNGGNASKTMGPATVMAVEKGDKLKLSVFANYSNSGTFGTSSNFALPNLGAGTSFGLEGANFFGNGIGLIFSPLHLLNNNSNTPNAYAVIHLLDENGEVLQSHVSFVKHGAGTYREIELDFEVEKDGSKYAAVYLANESTTNVYFDDLEIEHTRLIWQENAYYPFGMGIKPLDHEPEGSSRFKYNEGSEYEEATGLYETEFRGLDNQIARWLQVDPKATGHESPYASMGNNPILFNDPLGDTIRINQESAAIYNQKKDEELGFSSGKNHYKEAFDKLMANYAESEDGAARIKEMDESDYGAATGRTNLDEDGNPKGSGGTILFDPEYSAGNSVDAYISNAEGYSLAHELLGHGIQYNRGILDRSNVPYNVDGTNYSYKHSELEAIHLTNVIRGQRGEVFLRESHDGINPAIDKDNRSVLPKYRHIDYFNNR
ncbi:MAG: RHS repeat-associated protein [Flammeovirgaceae bacterium]|jgi:RHS repeat-associated protein